MLPYHYLVPRKTHCLPGTRTQNWSAGCGSMVLTRSL